MITNQTNAASSPRRLGCRQLETIAEQLDPTDYRLLNLLGTHRYATTRQLSDINCITNVYANARSALRQTTRRLNRHHALGLIDHLARRIGGVRAGSTGYIWYLREPGHRLTTPDQPRRYRHSEPSRTFLAHTLAITEARLVIERAAHDVGGHLSVLRTEPDCWRQWLLPGGGRRWLKPDLEAITTTATDDEDHWLFEIDLDTENPARLLTKCHDYQDHLNTGTEQASAGYYPQVVWIMNNPRRAARLTEQIAANHTFTPGLFKIVGSEIELKKLIQGGLEQEIEYL